jgi:hypothetical protein
MHDGRPEGNREDILIDTCHLHRKRALRVRMPEMNIRPDLKIFFALIVSMVVLCVALYIITSTVYAVSDKNWAYSVVGTVIGYWLKRCICSPLITAGRG